MSTATHSPTGTASAASRPTQAADPRRMATIAALLGVAPPQIAGATVVDLGCGDAANLLGIAAAHPSITAVGVDPSPAALQRARAISHGAGLANVSFEEGTAALLADGTADFVIASDVLSWVDSGARAALIAEAARLARSGGLVMLSYDASPGAVGRLLTRSIGRRAAASAIDTGDADATREAVVRGLHSAARNSTAGEDFVALTTAEAERVAKLPPDRVLHVELSERWEPLTVADLAAQATEAGLTYLGELQPGDRWRERLAELEIRRVTKLAGAEIAVQQQLIDDMLGAASHASLFLCGAAPKQPIGGGTRQAAGPPAAQWHATPEHTGEWPQLPARLAKVAAELRAASPAGLPVAEIARRTGASAEAVRQAASILDAYGLARLDLDPSPAADEPNEHPQASALVRAQVRSGHVMITSLRHREVRADDPRLRELLLLLDGTRDRAALTAALAGSPIEGASDLSSVLDHVLAQLAEAGVLSA